MNFVVFETASGETTPVIVLLSNTNVTVYGSAAPCVGLYHVTLVQSYFYYLRYKYSPWSGSISSSSCYSYCIIGLQLLLLLRYGLIAVAVQSAVIQTGSKQYCCSCHCE